jgi:hypothetical protein
MPSTEDPKIMVKIVDFYGTTLKNQPRNDPIKFSMIDFGCDLKSDRGNFDV